MDIGLIDFGTVLALQGEVDNAVGNGSVVWDESVWPKTVSQLRPLDLVVSR